MKSIFTVIIVFVIFSGCKKIPEISLSHFPSGKGLFLVNEGNFMAGNGSVSFFSYDSAKLYLDLFNIVNLRPLGDTPNSVCIYSDKLYIVVNNSGKIEVTDKSKMTSEATITNLNSPRNMAVVNDSKAYLTSIYSDSVTIIDLNMNSVSGYINLRRSSESIIISDNRAFISNWMGGKEIMVVNTQLNKVIDSIQVGIEPESMVIDKNKKIWVLCNGGWLRQNYAELVRINSLTNQVEQRFLFSSKLDSPTSLQIDGAGENLYFIMNGVMKMNILSAQIPSIPHISQGNAFFYKLAVNPENGDLFVTDAADYVQKGFLNQYKNDGTLILRSKAEVIPGSMCFRLN